MKKFTTYIIGNITVRESDEIEAVEIGFGSDMRIVSKSDFIELCGLQYDVRWARVPKAPVAAETTQGTEPETEF